VGIEDGRRPVTVGVDGSDDSLRAVRWAAAEARRRRAPLRLVTAFGWPPERPWGHPTLREEYREILHERTEVQLNSARAVAERTAQGIDVEAEVVVGSPYGVLGSEAGHAQLLVLGSRGRNRLEGLLAGSVTVALAGHASCPVVIVRGIERDPAEEAGLPVVVGVGGDPGSDAAVAFAFEAASARGVALLAVHVWQELAVDPVMEPFVDQEAIHAEERDVLDRRLAELLGEWSLKHPEVPVRRLVTRDRPGRCLVERSADAQLVVVGSRGRGELAAMVLGSVSNALVHRAHCPVAVVRG
jgi:nucleotide-binding universal stress UspA family protein